MSSCCCIRPCFLIPCYPHVTLECRQVQASKTQHYPTFNFTARPFNINNNNNNNNQSNFHCSNSACKSKPAAAVVVQASPAISPFNSPTLAQSPFFIPVRQADASAPVRANRIQKGKKEFKKETDWMFIVVYHTNTHTHTHTHTAQTDLACCLLTRFQRPNYLCEEMD